MVQSEQVTFENVSRMRDKFSSLLEMCKGKFSSLLEMCKGKFSNYNLNSKTQEIYIFFLLENKCTET